MRGGEDRLVPIPLSILVNLGEYLGNRPFREVAPFISQLQAAIEADDKRVQAASESTNASGRPDGRDNVAAFTGGDPGENG